MNPEHLKQITFKNALKVGGVIFVYVMMILFIIVAINVVIGTF